jgi:undecaprenyl diphosphate synthase
MHILDKIDKENLPQHIAVIMDGNGRWAKKHGKSRIFGHRSAVQSVRDVIEGSAELGIKYLTLYAFSKENWNRPQYEVNALMQLLVSTLRKEIKTLNKNNIRLISIGDKHSLPGTCLSELLLAQDSTKNNDRMTVILALSYGSKWELTHAVRNIVKDALERKINIEDIDEEFINNYLETKNIPDPELLIRTSGEQRISNFLLWQIAYAELYFTDVLWPDFRKEHLHQAIYTYQQRERRFGQISEQLVKQ